MRRVLAELALGIRLAFSGGRRGTVRTALATLGVAIGAAGLLVAASVPVMMDARHARNGARIDTPGERVIPAGRTTVIAAVDGQWGNNEIRGRLIWPEAPGAPLPPGVPAFPGDHRMYVSPALREALAGPDGATLRRQMPYEIVGTIAPTGLVGPHEYAYYAGYRRATGWIDQGAWRIDRFGYPDTLVPSGAAGTYAVLVALLATLLLPVAIFIGAALRFGGDTRDRRLAAIRLIGADRRAVLRMALGESLVPAGLGLLTGTALYLLVRGQVAHFWLLDVSVYPSDVRPVPGLAALVVIAVVLLSAGVTLLGFRGVAVEPLGVLRRAAVWKGRLWWRLIPFVLGAALLPLNEMAAGVGVALLVAGVIPLLPYLVPLVARMHPGGPVSWQLASQQLRRNPTSSVRAVSGIVVAVAGAIALQSVFGAADAQRYVPDDAADPAFVLQTRSAATTDAMLRRTAMFEQVHGVRAGTVAEYPIYVAGAVGNSYLYVGDCESLSQIATLTAACGTGTVFTFGPVGRTIAIDQRGDEPAPGVRLALPANTHKATLVGSNAQSVYSSVLMTTLPPRLAGARPDFVETRMFTAGRAADVAGQLRGVAAEIDPLGLFTGMAPEGDAFGSLRTALDIGSVLILLIMAVGLLLDLTARLHERRRVLGVLAAVGARRSTVVWSVLLQIVVPVVAGLVLAAGAGTGIGALLMRAAQVPIRFGASAIVTPLAAGAALVLVTTVGVLLPAIRRVTRTEELRYE